MNRFYFNIGIGEEVLLESADSNSRTTAITMVMAKLSDEQKANVDKLEIYAIKELAVEKHEGSKKRVVVKPAQTKIPSTLKREKRNNELIQKARE